MPEDMFENNEEMMERDMVRVELSAKFQTRFDNFFDHQFQDVDKVALLNQNRITICKNNTVK